MMECLCPVLLMLVLVGMRTILDPVESGNLDMYTLQAPLYPPGLKDRTTKEWKVTQGGIDLQAKDMFQFLNYTNYTTASKSITNETYAPGSDFNSPYWFMPP